MKADAAAPDICLAKQELFSFPRVLLSLEGPCIHYQGHSEGQSPIVKQLLGVANDKCSPVAAGRNLQIDAVLDCLRSSPCKLALLLSAGALAAAKSGSSRKRHFDCLLLESKRFEIPQSRGLSSQDLSYLVVGSRGFESYAAFYQSASTSI